MVIITNISSILCSSMTISQYLFRMKLFILYKFDNPHLEYINPNTHWG